MPEDESRPGVADVLGSNSHSLHSSIQSAHNARRYTDAEIYQAAASRYYHRLLRLLNARPDPEGTVWVMDPEAYTFRAHPESEPRAAAKALALWFKSALPATYGYYGSGRGPREGPRINAYGSVVAYGYCLVGNHFIWHPDDSHRGISYLPNLVHDPDVQRAIASFSGLTSEAAANLVAVCGLHESSFTCHECGNNYDVHTATSCRCATCTAGAWLMMQRPASLNAAERERVRQWSRSAQEFLLSV